MTVPNSSPFSSNARIRASAFLRGTKQGQLTSLVLSQYYLSSPAMPPKRQHDTILQQQSIKCILDNQLKTFESGDKAARLKIVAECVTAILQVQEDHEAGEKRDIKEGGEVEAQGNKLGEGGGEQLGVALRKASDL